MTSISIEALKEKTIGEVCELVQQAERLPDNHSPSSSNKLGVEDKGTPIRGLDVSSSSAPMRDAKTQTVQDIIDEIQNEK